MFGCPLEKNCCSGLLGDRREGRVWGRKWVWRSFQGRIGGRLFNAERVLGKSQNVKFALLLRKFEDSAELLRIVVLGGGRFATGEDWGPKRDRIANHSPLAS
jgi:hypothetical protein